jgi:ubiquinone/menaquinone biosynthesis C-methylase UbiE
MTLLTVLLAAFSALTGWLICARITHKLHPRPAPPWMGRFLDSGLRHWLQSPQTTIARSGIRRGLKVLELGCGSGAFTTAASRATGESGVVYAVDLQRGMLRQLQRKLARRDGARSAPIHMLQAGAYRLPFADGSLDLAYLVTVLPEIPDPGKALREVRRVLRPGGILAITEFLPDPDYPRRVTTIGICQQAGFQVEGTAGNLWAYTVRARKPA